MAAQAPLRDDNDAALAQRKAKATTPPAAAAVTQPTASAAPTPAPTIATVTAPPTIARTLTPRAAVDGGDTASSASSNRSASMGQMVNGVRTFSDGTGGIQRTLSSAQLDSLGASRLTGAPDAQSTSPGTPKASIARTLSGDLPNANGSPAGSGPNDAAAQAPSFSRALGGGSSSAAAQTTARGYYDNPSSPGYDSGFAQLGRAISRAQEDNAVRANPVGPPSLLSAPTPNNDLRPGVRVNPTATDLANEGALRPASGNFSAANPQPLVDAGGRTMQGVTDTSGITRTLPISPAATAARTEDSRGQPATPNAGASDSEGFSTNGGNSDGAKFSRSLSDPAPATAANANTLGGITRGLSDTSQPVRSDSGRLLGYGQMVNGVRTFSDGTGGIPRTMSDADIANLAKESRLTSADAGIGGGIASEAYRDGASLGGGAANRVLSGTPELGSQAGYALSRPMGAPAAQDGGRFHMPSASAQAASDLASIIGRDTRTPLGLAMRNNDVEVKGRIKPRRIETMTALAAPALEGLRQAGALAQENAQQGGSNMRAQIEAENRIATTRMNNQGELDRAIVNRPTPTQVPMGDGTLGLLGQDGIVRPATDAQGNPVRQRVKPTTEEIKALDARAKLILGLDPDTGLKRDGTPPTARDLQIATAAARAGLDAESEAHARMRQQADDEDASAQSEQQALMKRFTTGAEYVDARGNRARWTGNGWEHL